MFRYQNVPTNRYSELTPPCDAVRLLYVTLRVLAVLQLLSFLGYVELDYEKIEGKIMGVFDFDKDGKVTAGDFDELYKRVMKVISERTEIPTLHRPYGPLPHRVLDEGYSNCYVAMSIVQGCSLTSLFP